VEECGPCAVFASFTLAFALQLRKKHGKTSVRVRKTSVRVQYTYCQNTHILQNPHKHTHYKTHTHTHTHTHTLQNNIKPPQYKLKQHSARYTQSVICLERFKQLVQVLVLTDHYLATYKITKIQVQL